MGPRLPTGPRPAKSDPDLRSDTAGVLYEAIPRGYRKMVAAACSVSPDRIEKQMLGEEANWLEKLTETIDRLFAEGVDPDRALLPVTFLAERYGHELTPVLEVLGTVGVQSAVAGCIREAGEACSEALDGVRDGSLDERERSRAIKQGKELIQSAHRLVAELQALDSSTRAKHDA
jgi:hypothetical protein